MATTRTISTLAGLAATIVLLVAWPAPQDTAHAAQHIDAVVAAPRQGEALQQPQQRGHGASHTPSAYGWPLKPFHRQHPVRGFFGDPRIGHSHGRTSTTFHFGIDISAPDGTPVYATASGRIVVEAERPETVSIIRADGSVFAYWHIVPAVHHGGQAVAYATLLGHISAGWGHVHFAEFEDGRYLNPLRPGALGPYVDETEPTVHTFGVERNGKGVGRTRIRGSVDLVAEVWDTTPLPVPGKWADKPVMPALVRWRLLGASGAMPWRTAVDFSTTIPAPELFGAFYARWTRQNHPWRNGRYRVLLARGWDSSSVPRGAYVLVVEAVDTRGNRGRSSARLHFGGRT